MRPATDRRLRATIPGLALVATACAVAPAPAPTCPPAFRADAWAEADRLFRRDPHWVGGDGAYSIDLGGGRVLWLFGDSVIDPGEGRARTSPDAEMVSNTLAIQHGYDPSTAEIRFYWREGVDGRPAAFFADASEYRYWPGHGIVIEGRLLLFLMKVRGSPEGLGFEVFDWDAVLIGNPEDEPSRWEIDRLDAPDNDLQVIVGSASVVADGAYVHAFSYREPRGGEVYLVRWPARGVARGDLRSMEWWSDGDWVADGNSSRPRRPVLLGGQTEFTVHRDPAGGCWLQVQTVGFGAAELTLRSAPRLTGPWTEPSVLFRPPEYDRPRAMIYQGKAHPHLDGADLVLTYSTNSFDFQELIDDETIYYPRFVRLRRK